MAIRLEGACLHSPSESWFLPFQTLLLQPSTMGANGCASVSGFHGCATSDVVALASVLDAAALATDSQYAFPVRPVHRRTTLLFLKDAEIS
mgnify:CR=1 FL=1